jgi:alpha-1,2-mannosyltransferase
MPVRARTDRAALATRVGLVVMLVVAAALAIRAFGPPYRLADLATSHDALRSWLDGDPLYRYENPDSGRGFSYSPFTALLMAPLAWLPATVAAALVLAADLAALVLVLIALLAPLAGRYELSRWYVVAVALPLALATEPVRAVFGLGQLDLLVLGLIVADLIALRRRSRAAAREGAAWRDSPGFRHLLRDGPAAWGIFRQGGGWAGVGIGIAAAIKVTPALFIVYLLVTRQWRAARTALVTVAVVVGLTALLARDATLNYFGRVLWQVDRLGPADAVANQSLGGVLSRLYESAELPVLLWLTFSLVVVAVGLSRAVAAHAEGDELAAFTLVGLSAAVAAPVSFTHHLLFLLPAVLVLVDGAAYRRERPVRGNRPRFAGAALAVTAVALYLLLVVAPMWIFDGDVAENAVPLVMIALVCALPWRPGAEPGFLPRPWSELRAPRRPVRQRQNRPVRQRGPVRGS